MNIKKIISVFTAACFFFTFAGQNFSWAASENNGKATVSELKKVFDNVPQIPAQYGKITNISDFESKSIVINIQDLHCHPETQRNISKIIETLDKNYNVKCVYVEGAYGSINTGWLSNIENESLRNSITERLLQNGRLSAAEYYSVKNNKKDFLFGIEDEKKHKENIKRLSEILDNGEKYSVALSEIKSRLDYLDSRYTNAKNKRFNKILHKYQNGEMPTEKFYAILNKYINKINERPQDYNNVLHISLSDYPEIRNYLLLTEQSSKVNMKKVSAQLQSLVALFKETLPYKTYQMFVEETENLSNPDKLSLCVTNICDAYGLDLGVNYKELNAFLKCQQLNRNLNSLKIISEERHMIERVRAALSFDKTENEIAFLSDFYGLFSDYLQNKLMADDFEYFSARFAKFRELYSKYSLSNVLALLEKDFGVLNAYYNLNDDRNTIFIDNIMRGWNPEKGAAKKTQNKPDKEYFENAKDIVIVVTGGYHSRGLQRLLDERKITSMVITPSVTTGTGNAVKTYEQIIKEQSVFLKEALAFTIASQAETGNKFVFLINAGLHYIESAGYSRETINALIKALRSSVGQDYIKNAAYGDNETVIEFSGGNKITIQNENGKLSLKDSVFNEDAQKPGLALNDAKILEVSEDFLKFIFSSAASLLKGSPDLIYDTVKNFFVAASASFPFSDGPDYEAYEYIKANKLSSVDGIKTDRFFELPLTLQRIIVKKEILSAQKDTAPQSDKTAPAGEESKRTLELESSAVIADAKGLTGIKRAFFVSHLEFKISQEPGFAKKHKNATVKEYKTRLKGEISIKIATFIGTALAAGLTGYALALAAASVSAFFIPLFVILGVRPVMTAGFLGGYALNVLTHAVYNITHPDILLEIAYDSEGKIVLEEDQRMRTEAILSSFIRFNARTISDEDLILYYYAVNALEFTGKEYFENPYLKEIRKNGLESLGKEKYDEFSILLYCSIVLSSKHPETADQDQITEKLLNFLKDKFRTESPEYGIKDEIFTIMALNLLSRSLALNKNGMNLVREALSGKEIQTVISYLYELSADKAVKNSPQQFAFLRTAALLSSYDDKTSEQFDAFFKEALSGILTEFNETYSAVRYGKREVIDVDQIALLSIQRFITDTFVRAKPEDTSAIKYLIELSQKKEFQPAAAELLQNIIAAEKKGLIDDTIIYISPKEHLDTIKALIERGDIAGLFDFAVQNDLNDIAILSLHLYKDSRHFNDFRTYLEENKELLLSESGFAEIEKHNFFSKYIFDKKYDPVLRFAVFLQYANIYAALPERDGYEEYKKHVIVPFLYNDAVSMLKKLSDSQPLMDEIRENYTARNDITAVYALAVILVMRKAGGHTGQDLHNIMLSAASMAKINSLYKNANAGLLIGADYLDAPLNYIHTLAHELGHQAHNDAIPVWSWVKESSNEAIKEFTAEAFSFLVFEELGLDNSLLEEEWAVNFKRLSDSYYSLSEPHILARSLLRMMSEASRDIFETELNAKMLIRSINITIRSGVTNDFYEFSKTVISRYLYYYTGNEVDTEFSSDRDIPAAGTVRELFKKALNNDYSPTTDNAPADPNKLFDFKKNETFEDFFKRINPEGLQHNEESIRNTARIVEYFAEIKITPGYPELYAGEIKIFNRYDLIENGYNMIFDPSIKYYIVSDYKVIAELREGDSISFGSDKEHRHGLNLNRRGISPKHFTVKVLEDAQVIIEDTSETGTKLEYIAKPSSSKSKVHSADGGLISAVKTIDQGVEEILKSLDDISADKQQRELRNFISGLKQSRSDARRTLPVLTEFFDFLISLGFAEDMHSVKSYEILKEIVPLLDKTINPETNRSLLADIIYYYIENKDNTALLKLIGMISQYISFGAEYKPVFKSIAEMTVAEIKFSESNENYKTIKERLSPQDFQSIVSRLNRIMPFEGIVPQFLMAAGPLINDDEVYDKLLEKTLTSKALKSIYSYFSLSGNQIKYIEIMARLCKSGKRGQEIAADFIRVLDKDKLGFCYYYAGILLANINDGKILADLAANIDDIFFYFMDGLDLSEYIDMTSFPERTSIIGNLLKSLYDAREKQSLAMLAKKIDFLKTIINDADEDFERRKTAALILTDIASYADDPAAVTLREAGIVIQEAGLDFELIPSNKYYVTSDYFFYDKPYSHIFSFTGLSKYLFPPEYIKQRTAILARNNFNSVENDYAATSQIRKNFAFLKEILAYNSLAMEAMNRLIKEDATFDDFMEVTQYVRKMIEDFKKLDKDLGSAAEKSLDNIISTISSGKEPIKYQKDIHTHFRIRTAREIEQISTLHTLINEVHQSSIRVFKNSLTDADEKTLTKVPVIEFSERNKNITAYNLSEGNRINDEIIKFFKEFIENNYDFSHARNAAHFNTGTFIIYDDTVLWSVKLANHSVDVFFNFGETDRSISISFYERGSDYGKQFRVEYFSDVLKLLGFDVKIDVSGAKSAFSGLTAAINGNVGLKDKTDLTKLAARVVTLFRFSNNLDTNRRYYKTFEAKKKLVNKFMDNEIWYEYDKHTKYAPSLNGVPKPDFDTARQKFNGILDPLGIDLIPERLTDRNGNTVTELTQEIIDEYFNGPVERAYAEGRILLNTEEKLVKNPKFDIQEEVIESLSGKNADLGFRQGAIINQIVTARNFRFIERGITAGQYVIESGYIQLKNGDFLSVKTLKSKGGTIKTAIAELLTQSGRQSLTDDELINILKSEGYGDIEKENISAAERKNLIRKLRSQNIFTLATPSINASVTSEGLTGNVTGSAVIDTSKDRSKLRNLLKENPDALKDIIWIVDYTTPDDIDLIEKVGAIITLGVGRNSHAAITTREKKKISLILDGKATSGGIAASYSSPQGKPKKISSVPTVETEAVKTLIADGDLLSLNSANGKIILLDSGTDSDAYKNIISSLHKFAADNDFDAAADMLKMHAGDNGLLERIIEYIYFMSGNYPQLIPMMDAMRKIKKSFNDKLDSLTEEYKFLAAERPSVQALQKQTRKEPAVKPPVTELKIEFLVAGFDKKLDSSDFGSKGANLAEISKLDIPGVKVPYGIGISAETLRYFLKFDRSFIKRLFRGKPSSYDRSGEFDELSAVFEEAVHNGDIGAAKKAGETIIQIINSADNPDLKKYIESKLDGNTMYAVRSSGIGEDGKEHAFAGMGTSKARQPKQSVYESVKECWVSFYSDRAIEYMVSTGGTVSPAVVIQEWVDFNKSGVILTSNNNGNIAIDAAYGEGEGVVSGIVSPDSVEVNKKNAEIIDYEVAYKKTQVLTSEAGSALNFVQSKTKARALNNEEIKQLTDAAIYLEKHYGYPVDIEFGFDNNDLYIVQVRPVTALESKTPPKAILPENAELVKRLAQAGKGALTISAIISFVELSKAVFHPIKFIKSHPENTGAKIVVAATYAVTAAAALTAMLVPVFPAVSAILAIPAGLFANLASHIITDYRYLKHSGLIQKDAASERKYKLKTAIVRIMAVVLIAGSLLLTTSCSSLNRAKEEYNQTMLEYKELLFDEKIVDAMIEIMEIDDDPENIQKTIDESFETTIDEKNKEFVEKAYDKLESFGITFKDRYTVVFVENTDSTAGFTLASRVQIVIPANVLQGTDNEIINKIARFIAHEGSHRDTFADNITIMPFENEARAYGIEADAMEALGGFSDKEISEVRNVSKAFTTLLSDESTELLKTYLPEYLSDNPRLNYVMACTPSIDPELKADEISMLIHDETMTETDKYIYVKISLTEGSDTGKITELGLTDKASLIPGGAILPQNIVWVNEAVALNNKNALQVASAITFKELFHSVAHPADFIKSHKHKTGAIILVSVTYASLLSATIATAALLFPFISFAAMLPAPIAGIVFSIFSNAVTHIIIDYHYLKSSGLIEAVREFGSAATLDENGYVNLPVYVINDAPENHKELNFTSSGVQINGNPLWIGKANGGITVYAQGASYEEIAAELAGNRKINDLIKTSAKDGANLRLNNISVFWIEVDHSGKQKSIGYSSNGNIQVSYDLFTKMLKKGEINDFSASLRSVRNTDAFTYGQGLLHYLDYDTNKVSANALANNLKNPFTDIFKMYLSQHQKMGNGQIVIDGAFYDELIKELGKEKFISFLLQAQNDGVGVFLLNSGQMSAERMRLAGFAGHISRNSVTGKMMLYNFAFDSESEVNEVNNFNTLEELENAMKNSNGSFLIYNSKLENALNSERTGMYITDIIEVLSGFKILKIFADRPVTADFAKKAAGNFEIRDMPSLTQNKFDKLTALIGKTAGNITAQEMLELLEIKESNPIYVYITKLKSRTNNNAEILNSFARGIAERLLAADALKKENKPFGLKNHNHEVMLGRALFAKAAGNSQETGLIIDAATFGSVSVRDAEEKLAEALLPLASEAFNNNNAKALNSVIELITAFSEERKRKLIEDDIKPSMNMRNYQSILSAA